MPSVYERQAISNENTARAAQKGFPDWAVIMCFYASLHWINDYAFRKGEMDQLNVVGISPHTAKRKYVKKIARLNKWSDLEDAYEILFRESMTARYLKDLEGLDCTATEHYLKYGTDFCFECLETIKTRLTA